MRLLPLALLVFAASGAARAQDPVTVQAEDATLIGNAAVATDRDGYAGTGYVTGLRQPGDSLRFEVEAPGDFLEVRLAVAGTGRIDVLDVWIDGVVVTTGSRRVGGGFHELVVLERRLGAGPHTVTVHGSVDVDYLTLAPRAPYAPPAPPPARLSDPEATDAARALFAFLRDEYGRHVLSAQQDIYQGAPRTAEIDYVEDVTGEGPAIGGFDLIEYSPSRVERSGAPGAWAEAWAAWAQEEGRPEGIVNLMWHWNAPTDLYDTSDQPWWRGFYTEATSFDLEAALAEGPGGERYDLLLRDIDAIAAQLQTFADADVPVLWRPLHEAAGGWFWWGAKGPGPLVELWRLMHGRLTEHHGLHNLIWVWTYESAATPLAWYPGDAYVDVVGVDVYADNPETLMRDEWDTLQEAFGGEKLTALTESGTLPDMDDAADLGVWWSWFSLWNGFQRDVPAERLARIYGSETVLTRDELPDWRSYTLNVAASDRPDDAGLDLALFPNPAAGAVSLRLTLDAPAEVAVDVFDLTGRRVARQSLGAQPAGMVTASLALNGAAGTYVVRVTAGDRVARDTVTVVR